MPALHAGDQVVGAEVVGAGHQRHVGHPLDRDVAGGVGVRTAVGPAVVQLRLEVAHRAVELVAHQHAVADDVPLLGPDALVVVADRGQAVLLRAVAPDVHHGGAVLEGAELVVGREGRAGVVGLVAQRAVELGGVTDRLVDGEPQVGRVHHEVVGAGLDGGRLQLLREQLGHLRELGVPVPVRPGEVLPPAAHRRRDGGHRVEDPGLRVLARGLEAGLQPHPLLGGPGAAEVGVVLVLLHLLQEGGRVGDGRTRAQALGPVDQQRGLLRSGYVERVDVVARDPGDVVVHRLGRQLDGRRGHRRGHPRDRHGRLGDATGLVVGQDDAGGEAPGALVDDADGEAEVLGVARGLEDAVAGAEVLVAVALEPEVRVAGAQLLGAGEGHLAEPAVRQVAEGRVEPGRTHGVEPIGGCARCRLRLRLDQDVRMPGSADERSLGQDVRHAVLRAPATRRRLRRRS